MAKTARHVHLPIEEARHCKIRLGCITMGNLARMSDSASDAIIEVYKLLDKQLKEIDNG